MSTAQEVHDALWATKDIDIVEWRDADVLVLGHIPSRRGLMIKYVDLLEAGASQVLAILRNERTTRVLTHVCRIVGYFSFMHVWNKSKIAEARDRGRGDYALPEAKAA